jgi:DNA-binding transcriptional LysR family regulator
LTDSGQPYYEACRRLLDELSEAERDAAGEYRDPRGELIITAPIVFGRMHLTPIVAEFLKAYPEVDVRLLLVDRIVNLIEEQVDLAVRISELSDSSMIAVRVGTIQNVVCASPTYLALRGTPRHPNEIARHDCIARTTLAAPDVWPFRIGKAIKMISVGPRLAVTTAEAAIEAAIAGAGLTRAFCYQTVKAENADLLTTVLREYEPDPLPLSLVYASARMLPLKLRAFVDYAVPRLKQRLQQS